MVRGPVIVGYIGAIGTGKTMNAARDSIELARKTGACLVSNIRLRDHSMMPAFGERAVGGPREIVQLAISHDGIDLEHLRLIIEAAMACGVCFEYDEFGDIKHGGNGCERWGVVVLLDEVGILMPARFWQSFPIDLMFELSQSRKSGVDFNYTAQDVEQVDAVLRRLSQYVWMVKAFPAGGTSINKRRPWFFMMAKWKVKHIESERKNPLSRVFRLYRRKWERVYSTSELVRPPERLRKRGKAETAWT